MKKILFIIFIFSSLIIKAQQPVIVFSDDFESDVVGTSFPDAKKQAWNLHTGAFQQTNLNFVTDPVHGKVLQIKFNQGEDGNNGGPITDTRLPLDSLYRDLWQQFKFKADADFDWSCGGKLFGCIAWGNLNSVPYGTPFPYGGDTLNSGGNSGMMFHSGSFAGYPYTNTANHPGLVPSATVDRPSADAVGVWNGDGFYWGNASGNGLHYQWKKDGTHGGGWWAFPNLTRWNGSAYVPLNYSIPVNAGTWYTFTQHVHTNNYGQWDGFIEYYLNGVCVLVLDHLNMFRTIEMPNGANYMYLMAFFGGGCTSPKTQNQSVDDLVAYFYPKNNPNWDTLPRSIGDTITIVKFTGHKYINTPARPISKKFADATGIVNSHTKCFYIMPEYCNAIDTIQPFGATWIELNLTEYTSRGATGGDADVLNIYTWSGNTKTLVLSKGGRTNATLGTWRYNTNKITLEYASGRSFQYVGQKIGWTINYTSNGTSSGINYQYATAAQLLAPHWTGGGGTTPVVNPPSGSTYRLSDTLSKVNFYKTTTQSGWTNVPENSTTNISIGNGMTLKPVSLPGDIDGITGGIFPNNVMHDYHWINYTNTVTKTYKIWGVTDTIAIAIMSSVPPNSFGSVTKFNIGNDTITIDANNNDSTLALFPLIYPTTDTVRINVRNEVNNYGYITGLAIYECSLVTIDTSHVMVQDTLNAFDTIYATQQDIMARCGLNTVSGKTVIEPLDSNSYFAFMNVDFGSGADQIIIHGIHHPNYLGPFKIFLNSEFGTEIANFTAESTGSWNTLGYQTVNLNTTITGIHNIYIKSFGYANGSFYSCIFKNFNQTPVGTVRIYAPSIGNIPMLPRINGKYYQPE